MGTPRPDQATKEKIPPEGQPDLLAGAAEHLLDTGIARLSLQSAADALGVSHTSVLERFVSKDQLISEALSSLIAANVDLIESAANDFSRPTEQMLRANWQEITEPGQQGPFLLLFELVALNAREPGRFGALTEELVSHFLVPIENNLKHNGWGPEEGLQLATTILAVFRGLYLDLVMTGDKQRVSQALYRFIDMITSSHQLCD